MSILACGSSQFQNIERGAGESQYFSLFLRSMGRPKVEFDDTSNVIWGVRKWQYHRRGVSKINNLSVALARVKVFRYSYVAWESIFSFLQHPPRNIKIFSGIHPRIQRIQRMRRKRAKIGRPDPPEHARRGSG